MIRPRGGNFTYDAHELAIMKQDILICRDLGCTGIATGVLLPDGRIDTEQMKRIVEWAHPMAVTCHKAFDRTHDAFASLEALITAGCARVLTSGLQPTATEGAALLSKLVTHAAGRIIIMPGGGVRSTNIASLVSQTGAIEYHSSGIISKDGNCMADLNEVRSMAQLLNSSITQ
jgi:copper homeostasis protein